MLENSLYFKESGKQIDYFNFTVNGEPIN